MGEELQISKVSHPGILTVREALQEAVAFLSRAGVESARIDAEVLLGNTLAGSREEMYLNFDKPLTVNERKLFKQLLQRRAKREPVAYITGKREFWSLDFFVSPDVLVPRPETELLIEIALELAGELNGKVPLRILDLGTGSAAIAVSLARELGDAEIWVTDISSGALSIARANAARHGVEERIRFLQGDIFEPARDHRDFFDMVVSNPPYVRRGEIQDLPPEVRDWEPRQALDGGEDGMDFIRQIVQRGHLYLVGGGFVALEIGADLGGEVAQLFASAGCYCKASVHRDLAGRDRVIVARRIPEVDQGKGNHWVG